MNTDPLERVMKATYLAQLKMLQLACTSALAKNFPEAAELARHVTIPGVNGPGLAEFFSAHGFFPRFPAE